MKLILPIDGASSRYKGLRPKWMLTLPSGLLLIEKCIEGIDMNNITEIVIICLKKHLQENDFNKAGMPLSDGSITPNDILNIKGPSAVQQYLVNEVQEVYRLQGVNINDKHFDVVVRQMMRKVKINDPGDRAFLENQLVFKSDFIDENDRLFGKKIVEDYRGTQIAGLHQFNHDFSQVPDGNYTVVLKTSNHIFKEQIVIKK